MEVYTILLLWVIFTGYFSNKRISYNHIFNISGEKMYLFLSFSFIWILMAFRSPYIGTDTLAYSEYYAAFANANSLTNALNEEFLSGDVFKFLSYFLGAISTSSAFYIFWTSTFICIGIALYIYRTSKSIPMSTFLFLTLNLFFISMNIGRQWIAIVLSLNALIFIYKDSRSILGWGLFFLSIGIHNVIALFLPAYISVLLVKRYGSNKFIYYAFILCALSCSLLSFVDMITVLQYFPHYIRYIDGTNPDGLIGDTGNGKIVIEYILFLCILVLLKIKNKKEREQVDFVMSIIPAVLFSVIIGIAFSKNNLMNRILIPYQCLFLTIIPYTLLKYKAVTRVMLYIILFSGLIFNYYLRMDGNLGNIIPYEIGI
ncbi:EpsG family protein [Mitsuokella jalaludinii]|uniref:EpsG family protein n=1 Tax=Mitsuokella jalaludinii TaxID=187979 RepID=UPI0020D12684|nr:EpsG family protein [Mitsuokella jalaludinii]MCQ1533893.1 EpsG family protein [Mitsuokella jalaludinii]